MLAGREDQPDGFLTPNSDAPEIKEQFFKRAPLITETAALYQQSHLFSNTNNNLINKLNFYLELALTLSIFASSILLLSIQSASWDIDPYFFDHDESSKVKKNGGADPVQNIENTIRLTIIGTSIAFFFVMCATELAQSLFVCAHVTGYRLAECYGKVVSFIMGSERNSSPSLTNKEIAYRSQLIATNVQMMVILVSVIVYGIVGGVGKGALIDDYTGEWDLMEDFQKEITLNSILGGVNGVVTAVLLLYVHEFEIEEKGPPVSKQYRKAEKDAEVPAKQMPNENDSDFEESVSLINIPNRDEKPENGIIMNSFKSEII